MRKLSRFDYFRTLSARVGIQLYERNTECSEALYGVIQGLEVALRNAIHNIMTDAVGTQEWYDKVAWDDPELSAIQEAKEKIKDRRLKETPGRVIAELTFGFWVKLTSYNYEQSLWFKYLHKIVPKTVRRKVLHGKLIQAKTLRNRIAHHERIVGRPTDLPTEYQQLIEIIGWLHLDISAWVESRNCFIERYRKQFKKNRPEPEAKQADEAAQIK
jgi:Abi-like protein